MTNNEKELDREAEQAFKNLTTAKADQNGFDQEFDVSFEHSTNDVHHKSAHINNQEIHRDGVDVLTQQALESVPTSLPSSPGSLSTSSSSEIPQPTSNDTTNPEMVYNYRAPQKHGRRSHTKKSSLPPGIRKLPSPPTTLEQAQMEWDMVETVQPGSSTSGISSPNVKFNEVCLHFQTAPYLEQHSSHIKPTIRRRGLSAITHTLFGPPKMNDNLHQERNLLFTLALCMFHNEEPVHNLILQTIYKRLTGTKLDCPRYGNHWELIGFQGLDPATDLRGCGLLGLVNLLYLVTDDRIHSLATDMYKLSQHETQNFPFCVMSINITRIALQALREGKLNKECNNRRSVTSVFCDFYVAIFFHIYQIWKHQHKTISDSGFVLKEGEKFALKKTALAFKQFEQGLIDRKNLVIPEEENISPKNKDIAIMDQFSGVCDLPSHEEEEVHLV